MSWIDKIQANLIITTGDGRQFTPLWIPTGKVIEFNVSEFEFPDLPGTLVKRTTPKGRKYNIEFFFQGENHLDEALAFEISANDKRPWTISHPYYDNIIVQPVSLSIDHSQYNVSKVTGAVIETITEDSPKIVTDPLDKILGSKTNIDELFVNSFSVSPTAADVNSMTSTNNKLYADGKKLTVDTDESEGYFNVFNNAKSAINKATSEPLEAARTVQSVINAPALFKTSVQSRIALLKSQFDILRTTLETLNTRAAKKIYELQGGALISSSCIASVTPLTGDYGSRDSVLRIMEEILSMHSLFLIDLDAISSEDGIELDSYIPEAEPLFRLDELMKYTVSKLYEIALGSKMERTVILEDDSNIIILAHRFYGLKPDDSTIEELMKTNDIGLSEILHIRKGRTLKYYV